jgi:uncharacterized protein
VSIDTTGRKSLVIGSGAYGKPQYRLTPSRYPLVVFKRFWAAALGALLFPAIAIVLLGSLLSRPIQARIGEPPAELGAHSVSFGSPSGAVISGWFAVVGERAPVLLLLPAVRANRLSMVDRALFLHRDGYSVLLVDLQAVGESKGEAITFGWRERLDVLAAVTFIRKHLPQAPIAILGSSLGGAAALLATPPLEVNALILEAVYPSIEKATQNRLRMHLGRAGAWAVPLLLVQVRPRLGVSPGQLRPIDHAGRVRCPVLVISGAADRHTTPEDTQLLYDRIASPKLLWIVPGAEHVDLHRAATHEYEERVLSFLAETLRR